MNLVNRVVGGIVGVVVFVVGAGFLIGIVQYFLDHPAEIGGWVGDLIGWSVDAGTAVVTFLASIVDHVRSM